MGGFHEVLFPVTISYGSDGGPGFNTSIVSVDSGNEERNIRWENGRGSYNVVNGVKTQAQLYDLITFYRARLGAAYGFRYKDWSDYATTVDGIDYNDNATTPVDTQIAIGDGVTTQFQLLKQYTSGPVTRNRIITKPVAGKVRIAVNGTEVFTFTVNTATGIVTFTSAPANGDVITAGFQFDVPVRFGEEVDKQLPIKLDDYKNGSVTVSVMEIADGGTTSDEFFYGGAIEMAITAPLTLSGVTRVWVINSNGASVILPDPASIPGGGPIFYIVNDGGSTFSIKDHLGTTLNGLNAGDMVEVVLSDDGAGTKVWYIC